MSFRPIKASARGGWLTTATNNSNNAITTDNVTGDSGEGRYVPLQRLQPFFLLHIPVKRYYVVGWLVRYYDTIGGDCVVTLSASLSGLIRDKNTSSTIQYKSYTGLASTLGIRKSGLFHSA